MFISKYLPLSRFFSKLDVTEITLTIEQVEKMLGFKLPKSSITYKAWWFGEKFERSRPSNAWIQHGWKVIEVVFGEKVMFQRIPEDDGKDG